MALSAIGKPVAEVATSLSVAESVAELAVEFTLQSALTSELATDSHGKHASATNT
ncbi:hypothetical protein JHD52_16075 [Lactobacillus sp. CRM56-2]|nr:hypothetical protein [Lactobacillus sp. CRM56-2]